MKSPSRVQNIIVETNGFTIHFSDGEAEFYPISRESRIDMATWLLTAIIAENRGEYVGQPAETKKAKTNGAAD